MFFSESLFWPILYKVPWINKLIFSFKETLMDWSFFLKVSKQVKIPAVKFQLPRINDVSNSILAKWNLHDWLPDVILLFAAYKDKHSAEDAGVMCEKTYLRQIDGIEGIDGISFAELAALGWWDWNKLK